MRVLVVSQYFPPEIGATQNRLDTFVRGLLAAGHQVTVICEQPCHPGGVFRPGYGRRPLVRERSGRLRVRRVWVAASPRKSTGRRLAFYGTFALTAAVTAMLQERHDVVFASSPPLPGVVAVAAVAGIRRWPLVVDVRDLWPAAAEALGELTHPAALRLAACLERWLYRAAAQVTATTRPFCSHIDALTGRPASRFLPNGALDALLDAPIAAEPPAPPLVVGYAGNLGIAQGLDALLGAAAQLREQPVRFRIIGDGPLREQLTFAARRDALDNVEFLPPVPVDEVGRALANCHVLVVPLGAHPALADFVPSKLFDAMAVGRPVITAAHGEAAELTRSSGAGIVVAPEDADALARAIGELMASDERRRALGLAGRSAAKQHKRSRQVTVLESALREAAR